MVDIDCNREIKAFHDEEVTLLSKHQTEMQARRDAGRTRLETGLNLKAHPQPKKMHSQGSYAMRTMVQDAENDYDIDDGAYFRATDLVDDDGKKLTPLAARERVCEALKCDGRLKYDATVKRNCVRQLYPQGYHIDVAVYRIVTAETETGEQGEHYEHASGDEWIESDARAVTRWYNGRVGELNAGEPDGSQLRRITKLTKKFSRRPDWKAQTTSGIRLSQLVVECFAPVSDRDDEALHETWKAIKNRLDDSTAIPHPVLGGCWLAEAGDSEVLFFQDCLTEALETLEILDDPDCSRNRARQAWDEVFDTDFFTDQPAVEENRTSERPALFVTSPSVARRDDGGGRFG